MARKNVTLVNNFHGTSVVLKAKIGQDGRLYLSPRQVRKAHKALCGSPVCDCGDIAGARPAQVAWASAWQDQAEIIQLPY